MVSPLSTSKLPEHMEGSGNTFNTCVHRPIPVSIPNGISIGSAIFAQLITERPYTLQWGAPFPPQNCSCVWRDLETCFLGPTPLSSPNGILIGSAISAQLTAECPDTLQWANPFLLKIAPLQGDLDPHLTRGSFGSLSPQQKRHVDRFSGF